MSHIDITIDNIFGITEFYLLTPILNPLRLSSASAFSLFLFDSFLLLMGGVEFCWFGILPEFYIWLLFRSTPSSRDQIVYGG